MQKIIGFFIICFVCEACTSVPTWWNPRATTENPIPLTPVTSRTTEQTPPATEELDLSLQDETYEEMVLTPLQDEENENEAGETSSQNIPEDESTELSENDLPTPSVLEE